jgi:hypothetical protein
MPTLSKPKLKEEHFVWRTPSRQMLRELTKNKVTVLEQLDFYSEHGRPEDFDGKFRNQVKTHEKVVLSEIAAALTVAASISASLSPSVLIATLKKVKSNPEFIFRKTFPAAVLWIVAQNYQRKDEKPGTYWPDIFGERPKKFPGKKQRPAALRITAAASQAMLGVQNERTSGRPQNVAHEDLAARLGAIFRQYNLKITRHSVESSRGHGIFYQIDSGPFLTFTKTVLKPLQAYLRDQGFSNVNASGVLKKALLLQAS